MTDYLFDLVIAQLWQVTVIAVMAWLLAETLFKNRPRLQYTVWTVVLLKCLVPPLAPSLIWPAIISSPYAWSNLESKVNVSIVIGPEFDSSVEVGGVHPQPLSPVATASYWPSFTVWSEIAGGVWLLGFGVMLSLVVVHLLWCRRQLRRVNRSPVRLLNALVSELREICPGRMVRVFATRGQFGPAAMSPLRPVIVVPGALAKQLAPDELRSILTHELMHVRRGDLWLGWMQMVAVCLFWFHPLIWLASRRLSVAIEQCCDEDSVRWLRCAPNVYRRSLAATLLWKNSVPTLPLASAIRPAQLTRCRMEALMKIDPLRPHRSWTARTLLLTLMVLLLPGAKWPVQATPPFEPQHAGQSVRNSEAENATKVTISNVAQGEPVKRFPKTYRVTDLLPKVGQEYEDVRLIYDADFDRLISEIQRQVLPDTWEANGGFGLIAPNTKNVAIVIATTLEVHDAVSEFLESKRARQLQEANAARVIVGADAVDAEAASTVELHSVMLAGHKRDLASVCDDLTDHGIEAFQIIKQVDPSRATSGELRKPWQSQIGKIKVEQAKKLATRFSQTASKPKPRLLSAPRLRLPLKQTAMVTIGDDIKAKYTDKNGKQHTMVNWGGVRLSLNADIVDQRTQLEIEWSTQELVSNEGTLPSFKTLFMQTNVELEREQAILMVVSDGEDDEKATLIAVWKSE